MAVVKTKRLVRFFEWNIKTIVFMAVHDAPISETVIVGPTRYFTRRVLITTHRDLSEAEAERLVAGTLKSDMRCHKCGRYGEYTKVDLKSGEAVCDSCDPSARYSLAIYEAVDIAFIETRGN
jgi:hypothetical protein